MHSKQKPPHSPGVDQTEVICPGERDRHMSVNLAVLNFGLGQRSQSDQKAARLWWGDRTSPMTQPATTYFPQRHPVLRRRCVLA